jgi:hypothetical protein
MVIVERRGDGPIVRPRMDARMGDNVNGPSLVRAPTWVERPLGRYYLYFAHHDGRYIRLAYADDVLGPWTTYEPGVLPLEASLFAGHVASPDVHVDEARREVRLYYHGADHPSRVRDSRQWTRVALSPDGLRFDARPEPLGRPYFRVFRRDGWHYALGMPGVLSRSRDGLTGFEEGPTLLGPDTRHVALDVVGETLRVYYTRAGDCPERILLATVEMTPDWQAWRASEPAVVLEPELPYEGGDLPREPSKRGLVYGPVCQLRDPAIFREDGRTYLLYSVAGEYGIALAEVLEGPAAGA